MFFIHEESVTLALGATFSLVYSLKSQLGSWEMKTRLLFFCLFKFS